MPESTLVVIDFETYWDSKTYTLSKMGPIEYVRNEKFTPQLCAFTLSNGSCCVDCSVVEHERLRTTFENLDTHDVAWCGHNMHGFDSLILSEFFDFHPQKIYDTIAMMRWTGLSRVCRESHAALTEFLGNGNKAAGTVVSDHKQWPDDFTPEERAFFIQYCKDDAGQCYQNAQDMLPYMTPDALRFMSITARMATEPSFVLDEDLLLEYLSDLDNAADKARQELMSMFSFQTNADMLAALRSADKFAVMLRSLGVEPPLKESAAKTKTKREKLQLAADAGVPGAAEELENMQPVMTYAFSKTDVDFVLMQDHPDPRVALLVRTRLQLNSSIDRSRAETLLKFARMHKPLPIMLGAWLAHTGRYSAGASADAGTKTDKLQFQNLSKRDPSKRKLRQAIKVPKGKVVVACDSSQIEARGLAFVANEVGLLTQFREGRDPYSELAETIFGVPWQDIKAGAKSGDKTMEMYRNTGKTGILSCGYSVGHHKYSNTLLRQGIHLHEDLDRHHELARYAHGIYRAAHPNIVAFWKTAENVLEAMLRGESGTFGGPNNAIYTFGIMPVGPRTDLCVPSVRFPSGYILRYPGLRAERNDRGKWQFLYDTYKGASKIPTHIYGGAFTNNLVQGLSFVDVIMYQGCRMDEAGIKLACNIHDAWASVVPEEQGDYVKQQMLHYMSIVPPALNGLPVACEAKIGTTFEIV
jgi:DNA polymerase